MDLPIIELRNYLIKPAQRDHFIDYFEEHFIASQQALNMFVLGQFRVIGQPDHFVWFRGFSDMATRLAGLQNFYSGPVWQKYRRRANEMILDSDHVHLFHQLDKPADLTGGRTVDQVLAELQEGTISPETGVVAVYFFQTSPDLVSSVSKQLVESYQIAGIHVRGCLASELSENDYPRLPVIQTPGKFVIISVYEDKMHFLERGAPSIPSTVTPEPHHSLLLAPTLRSPLRW
ncbi:MAG: NIPSNAP family protein [Anaerolineae bacterium]